MALYLDNCTSILSNCSSNTFMDGLYYNNVCIITFYIQVILICFIILPLNIWTLWLIQKSTTTHRGSVFFNLLRFNTVFASVIFCIGLFLKCLSMIYTFYNYLQHVSAWIRLISLIAQCEFHTWMFVEHYLAVVHPIIYLKIKQSWYKMVWVSFTWVNATVFGGVCMFIQQTIATLVYIIPMSGLTVLILFCGMVTLKTLQKHNLGEGEKKKMHHQKIKAFKIITLGMVVLNISYFPYMCFTLIRQQLNPKVVCTAQSIVYAILLPGAVFHSLIHISHFFKAQGP